MPAWTALLFCAASTWRREECSVAKRERLELRVSRQLYEAIKLSDQPAYRIALQADIHPAVLSRLLHGYERIKPDDARVLRVARIVGVPADRAFE
jgi:hypothetical protein